MVHSPRPISASWSRRRKSSANQNSCLNSCCQIRNGARAASPASQGKARCRGVSGAGGGGGGGAGLGGGAGAAPGGGHPGAEPAVHPAPSAPKSKTSSQGMSRAQRENVEKRRRH